MASYKAAFDHVPVYWLVALFNIGCGIYNIIEYGLERTWSFGSAIFNNLIGFDRYFIFLNNSCVPIPYHFYGGTRGEGAWLYDSRSRVFQSCTGNMLKRQVLPWLTMDLECTINGERCEYNLSEWMEGVTFYAHPGEFPHPLQLLTAWSLNSRVWPSLMRDANTQLKIIRAHDGEDMALHMYKDFSQFAWCETTVIDDEEEDDDEEPEDEDVGDENHEEAEDDDNANESSERSESPHEETLSLSTSSSENDIKHATIERSNTLEESKEEDDARPTLPLSDDSSSESSTSDNSLDVINEPYYEERDMEAVD